MNDSDASRRERDRATAERAIQAGEKLDSMRSRTPARLGIGHAGPRYRTADLLKFRADHARAVDAVRTEVRVQWPTRNSLPELRTEAATREQYLLYPERGRRLCAEDAKRLKKIAGPAQRRDRDRPSVLICVGDGLSSAAVEKNAGPLLRALLKAVTAKYRVMRPVFIRNARVRVEDHIGEIIRPDLVCILIGERPGLATAESLSAYVIYRPRLRSIEPDRTVISNIHAAGIPVNEAAHQIVALINDAIRYRATGAGLAQRLAELEQSR